MNKNLKIGDILSCSVDSIEDFGVYLNYKGEKIYVRVIDITWDQGPFDINDYIEDVNSIDVEIIGISKDEYFGAHFLGSIKNVSSEEDPWFSHNYSDGDIYNGKVVRIFEYGYLVRISTGAVGLIKLNKNIELKMHQNVSINILEVNTQSKRLLLDLVR